jgi:hypothetical protein
MPIAELSADDATGLRSINLRALFRPAAVICRHPLAIH